MPNPAIFTTKDFLLKVFDFFSVVGEDQKDFSFKALKSNPPSYIRLQQIVALYKAFINNDSNFNETEMLQAITSGSFLNSENIEDYYSLIATMEQVITRLIPTESKHKDWGIFALESNYERLMRYRLKANSLLSFNDGYLYVSFHNLYAKTTIDEINNQIKISFSVIDNILVKFIGDKSFSLVMLIAKYGFPTDDLDAIDADWV